MIQKVVKLLKENWIFIVIAVAVVVLMSMIYNTDKEYEGCSTCSLGAAGVLVDTEISGCSTCSAGDAGVLVDTETTPATEIYNMPDDYYESPMQIADTIAGVAHNVDETEAIVQDREDDVIIDPTDYAAQSDDQLVADFYGDDEIDYKKREEIRTIRFMPIDFDVSDGSFTLL
jgi:hypothetical protein